MSQAGENIDIFGRGGRGTRYRLIACEVAYRECCFAAAVSRNIIDLHFLTQGLHDLETASMLERVQKAVDETPAGRYEALLLGYGLCNGGVAGLTARDIPLVLPRAHDCITLFLGSKEAYRKHFDENPGTYYLTTGWVERDQDNLEDTIGREDNMLRKMGLDRTFEEYVEMYGEEHARMIFSTISGMENYRQFTHIDMALAPEAEKKALEGGREESARRGWEFERVAGRMDLFLDMADGRWDEEKFLVVQPGQHIEQTNDDSIVRAV